jgi:8-oxo-dGTP diphosphatase
MSPVRAGPARNTSVVTGSSPDLVVPADRRKSRIAVAAGVLLDNDGRALITRRPEGADHAGWWEFPGGKIERGETPLQGLIREFDEELGISVHAVSPLVDFAHEYPERIVDLHVWRITDYSGQPTGREGQRLAWVSIPDLMVSGLLPADQPIVTLLQQIDNSNSTL